MKQKTFSIRYKFLAVTVLLLVACLTVYLLIATREFKGDKTEFVYDYNKTLVVNISSDLESVLRSVSDKLRLAAYFLNEGGPAQQEVIQELLSGSSDLIFVGGSDRFEKIDKTLHVDPKYLETYGVNSEYFSNKLPELRPIPYSEIQLHGEWVWNASVPDGPPLIGYAKSVVAEASDGTPIKQYAVIAYVRIDKFMNSLGQGRLTEVVVVNKIGQILMHPNSDILYGKKISARMDQFLQAALNNPSRTLVQDYKQDGVQFLGAYSKVFGDHIIVVSAVDGASAFAAVNTLIWRSILFGLMIITLAFIAAVLFSRSLTRPIQILSEGMEKVSSGDLNTQIQVSTRDEIRILANSFNGMIRDLKKSREELEEINRELENKVKQRTAELERQNQAVKTAQEDLLRTTRLAAVGEIAGRAAHEVLNPLTSILSRLERVKQRVQSTENQELSMAGEIMKAWEDDYSQGGFQKLVNNWQTPSQVQPRWTMWQEDLENFKQVQQAMKRQLDMVKEDSEFLMREGQRISRIVNSMRSLSTVSHVPKNCSWNQVVATAVDVMADLAARESIKIKFENLSKDDQVYIDADECLQSLTNLLRNAIQAIVERRRKSQNFKDGEIVLKLSEESERLILEIKDNGIGIREDDKSHLFENQFTTKSASEGTGLGLSISRRFIRAFGGDIYLHDSKYEQGTSFIVWLPKVAQQTRETA